MRRNLKGGKNFFPMKNYFSKREKGTMRRRLGVDNLYIF